MRHGLRRAAALLLALAMALSAVSVMADDRQAASAPLGIISAMDVELEALIDAAQVEREDTIAGITFYVGTLCGVDVVLVKSGIGKVLAASCAETLIDIYQVGGVISTGVASSLRDGIDLMDMVVGTALVQHDYGAQTNDGFVWNGGGAADAESGLTPVDEDLSHLVYESARSVLGEDMVHRGVIATGDQFVASAAYAQTLQDNFDAAACEMEGGSVARVCDQFGVPCAVLRCMSDKAVGMPQDAYAFNYTEAANTSAAVVMKLLETMAADGTVLAPAKGGAKKDTAPRTAVISTTDEELAALADAAHIEKKTVIGGSTFYVGTLGGADVVLTKAGAGKVLAASCTAALLNSFTVTSVICTGVAEGVGEEADVMDMVIGTNLIQHDYGTETRDGFIWNGEAAADAETGLIPVDASLSAIAYNAAKEILGADKVHRGVIVTGDRSVDSETYAQVLQDKFDAMAGEMEGASVARVCDQFGVPCAVFRSISGSAGTSDTSAFHAAQAADASAAVVTEMLEALTAKLPFTDVANTSWYFSAVSEAYTSGLMSGTTATAFSPNGTTTRGMIVTILYRLAEEPEVTQTAAFTDVAAGKYYADAVAWASANGIVTGYGNGTFAPNQAITREQLAVILYRYARYAGADVTASAALDQFSDAASVSGYAAEAMAWTVAEGIISGVSGGTLSPKTGASRAQVATMLVRLGDAIAM